MASPAHMGISAPLAQPMLLHALLVTVDQIRDQFLLVIAFFVMKDHTIICQGNELAFLVVLHHILKPVQTAAFATAPIEHSK